MNKMNKMKSWADHCSSDEEDDLPRVSTLQISSEHEESDSNESDYEGYPQEDNQGQELEPIPHFKIPKDPPYTAFIGNLSFEVKDAKHLAYELEQMCISILGKEVTAIDGRLVKDKATGSSKGFGYVVFSTADELALVLELNNQVNLYGRKIRIDVANAPRGTHRPLARNRSRDDNHDMYYNKSGRNHSEIDGSQFRGGKHKNTAVKDEEDSNNTRHHTRPVLKLAPRSKPLEDPDMKVNKQSSIFGDAKPRDAFKPVPTPTAILKPNRTLNSESNQRTTATELSSSSTTEKIQSTDKRNVSNDATSHPDTNNLGNDANMDGNTKHGKGPSENDSFNKNTQKLKPRTYSGSSSHDGNVPLQNARNDRRKPMGKKYKNDKRGPRPTMGNSVSRGQGGSGGKKDYPKKGVKNNKNYGENYSRQTKGDDGWGKMQSNGVGKSIPEKTKVPKNVKKETKPKPSKGVNAFALLDSESD